MTLQLDTFFPLLFLPCIPSCSGCLAVFRSEHWPSVFTQYLYVVYAVQYYVACNQIWQYHPRGYDTAAAIRPGVAG